MMAASARTSGTRAPLSSSLKRGSATSRAWRATCAALARAAAALRLRAVEVAGFFASVRRFLVVVVERDDVERVGPAASDSAGIPNVATAANRQISRTVLNSHEV